MIGLPEVIIILVIALLILGPKRLPKLAKSVGRAVKEYKKAADDIEGNSRKVVNKYKKVADKVDKEGRKIVNEYKKAAKVTKSKK